MKVIALLLLFCAVVLCRDDEYVVTREYIEYLKRHVDWEVEDYETNIFRGWTIEEAKSFLGLIDTNTHLEGSPEVEYTSPTPESLSWAGGNCDHTPKNQGACGACWAFAIAGMLSDRCCSMTSDKGWLSPQELVTCDTSNFDCRGGSITSPINYIKKAGGLVTDACYPYIGRKEANCPTKCKTGANWRTSHVCKCNSSVNCSGSNGIIKCLQSGPVPIGFRVCQSFMSYKSGIYKCDCSSYIGAHATMAMGYSNNGGCNFLSKNSWGTSWGLPTKRGYFNIACNTCLLEGGAVCNKISG